MAPKRSQIAADLDGDLADGFELGPDDACLVIRADGSHELMVPDLSDACLRRPEYILTVLMGILDDETLFAVCERHVFPPSPDEPGDA